MDFQARQQHALALLDQTGMRRRSYAPLLLQLLWRAGFKVPPPHFMGFSQIAALAGIPFGIGWGVVMWLLVWARHPVDARVGLVCTILVGFCFGVCIAARYAHGKKKYRLPSWESLGKA